VAHGGHGERGDRCRLRIRLRAERSLVQIQLHRLFKAVVIAELVVRGRRGPTGRGTISSESRNSAEERRGCGAGEPLPAPCRASWCARRLSAVATTTGRRVRAEPPSSALTQRQFQPELTLMGRHRTDQHGWPNGDAGRDEALGHLEVAIGSLVGRVAVLRARHASAAGARPGVAYLPARLVRDLLREHTRWLRLRPRSPMVARPGLARDRRSEQLPR
jgi:hypothetical protein